MPDPAQTIKNSNTSGSEVRSLRGRNTKTSTLVSTTVLITQEEFSDEEDGQDEDLSAALATLRMQQEGRAKDGGSKRPGHEAGGRGGSAGGASGDGPAETAIRTQVSQRLVTLQWVFVQTICYLVVCT